MSVETPSIPHQESVPTQYSSGRHYEAYLRQTWIYDSALKLIQRQKIGATLLDFGCGQNGVSKSILSSRLRTNDQLHLHDTAQIDTPNDRRIRIVSQEQIFGPYQTEYDLISISYVLCFNEPDDSIRLLQDMRTAQREAMIIVIDYTLNGLQQEDLMSIFTAGKEKRWRAKLGDNEFFRTHTRFTPESLSRLIRDAGYRILGNTGAPLDISRYRTGFLAYPDDSQSI
ncbi:MAG: class I SAM-dependent methyltransferase [Kiritimatiellales bacterium]|nr:class I SAM-dependent methyltransferase [Kiritimatiellales bacterium]